MTDVNGLDAVSFVAIVVVVLYFLVPLVLYCTMLGRVYCQQQINLTDAETETKNTETEKTETDATDSHTQTRAQSEAVSISTLQEPPEVLISFENIRYVVPVKGGEKAILKGVSGYFSPRSLTAVMGPSGCGKTTLLDLLADQKQSGSVGGKVLVNGEEKSKLFRRVAAYVMQFDNLFPNLTARETLWFVAQLRLAKSVGTRAKVKRIEKLLSELDLAHVADERIGGNGVSSGGLSGGQRRRVTVAIELVTNPSLVLLDEPTSGLDAYGSLKVVKVLKLLAERGRTIVCTIHQPRADIFKLFDKLLLLKDGETMFFGDAQSSLDYFSRRGVEVDTSVNPADFVVDLTHVQKDANGGTSQVELDELVEKYRTSEEATRVDQVLQSVALGNYENLPGKLEDSFKDGDKDKKYVTTFFQQSSTLLHRSIMNEVRNGAYIGGWVLGAIMMLFYGTLYSNVDTESGLFSEGIANVIFKISEAIAPTGKRLTTHGTVRFDIFVTLAMTVGACTQDPDTLASLLNTTRAEALNAQATCGQSLLDLERLAFARRSLLYQLLAGMYFSESPVVAAVYTDRNMFYREHMSRSYSIPAWHFNWYVRLFFAGLLKGIVFSPLVYFPARLTLSFEAYALFSIFMASMSIAGSSVGLFVSSLVPSLETATVVFVVINIISQNLSGYFLTGQFIPPWFIWYYLINFFRYAFEGLVISQTITTEDRSLATEAWTFALIALLFAFLFQLLAVLTTWVVNERSSKGLKRITEKEEKGSSSKLDVRQKWLQQYRQTHRDSVRKYYTSTRSFQTPLPNTEVIS